MPPVKNDAPTDPYWSRLLGELDHEMREPLTDILGMARQLLKAELSPDAKRQVVILRASADVLQQQLESVQDLLELEQGDLTPEKVLFNLRETFQRTVDQLTPMAEAKGLSLSVEISERLPDRLQGDARRLYRLLATLLRRAVLETTDGFVRLSAELLERSGTSCVLRFTIRDTGPGRTGEELQKLLDRETPSLGLRLCRRLAEAVGGALDGTSRPGLGSSLWIDLPFDSLDPLDETWPGEAREGLAERTIKTPEGRRILVVEDEPINRLLAVSELEDLGYLVDAVPDGRTALRALAREAYDLVLMDCQMPVLDGYETTSQIRRREGEGRPLPGGYARLPIVAMTAHALSENREECIRCGMDDFLAKPYATEELRRMLERWLRSGAEKASPPASARIEPTILDVKVLTKLRGITSRGGDSLLVRAARRFLEEIPKRLEALRASEELGDFAQIGDLAHALKGASGMMGASDLAEHCSDLEAAARGSRPAEAVAQSLRAVEAAADRARQSLASLLLQEGDG